MQHHGVNGMRTALIFASLLFAASSVAPMVWAQTEKVGPSFDCSAPRVAQQPLAQIICNNDELRRVDLQYVIAYQAALHAADEQGKQVLWSEAISFVRSVQAACDIPLSGTLGRSAAEAAESCLKSQYSKQRMLIIGRLSGAAKNEAELKAEDALAIQRALHSGGYLSSTDKIDGVFGSVTREAIRKWQRATGREEDGFATIRIVSDVLSNIGSRIRVRSTADDSQNRPSGVGLVLLNWYLAKVELLVKTIVPSYNRKDDSIYVLLAAVGIGLIVYLLVGKILQTASISIQNPYLRLPVKIIYLCFFFPISLLKFGRSVSNRACKYCGTRGQLSKVMIDAKILRTKYESDGTSTDLYLKKYNIECGACGKSWVEAKRDIYIVKILTQAVIFVIIGVILFFIGVFIQK